MALVNSNTIDVASDSPVSQSLVQVNLLTGTNLNLGQLPSNGLAVTGSDIISALNFGTDGVLYALDALGNEFMIASNGAGIPVGNTGGQFWLDLTMASTVLDPPLPSALASAALDPPDPVPEPSSMALLLIAVLGLISARVRQRSGGSAGS
jgi:hypothetical protein